ncbi:MAG: prepilin-type N-terminal cleavage/methylation domain-containing protein [Candidatus Zixiibacteriota bacterium]
MKKVRAQDGFTLLEVMIAMLVLSIGILGLAPLIGFAIYGNTMASDMTGANALAQQEIEALVNQASYANMPYISTTDSVDNLFNVYRYVEDNSVNGILPSGIFKISVTVSWIDQQNQNRSIYYSTMKPKL